MRILYIRLPLLFFYAHVDVVIDLKHVNTAAARWAVGEPRAGRDARGAALLRADGVRRTAEHAFASRRQSGRRVESLTKFLQIARHTHNTHDTRTNFDSAQRQQLASNASSKPKKSRCVSTLLSSSPPYSSASLSDVVHQVPQVVGDRKLGVLVVGLHLERLHRGDAVLEERFLVVLVVHGGHNLRCM